MTHPVKTPRKLIEVALPLDAINVASAREKAIRHGHPSTLHLWWARRPLAAARAVIFSQMVNDPSWKWELEHPGEIPPGNLKASWAASRKRLFTLIEDLVKWENMTNETVLEKARAEIRKSWRETCEINKDHPQAVELFDPDKLPAFHDPFAGGGALPLEAQRLGLEAYASDLNPVAVLINKAMIEIPPKFAGMPPVNPDAQDKLSKERGGQWEGKCAAGLAEDVRYYGKWMREEAQKRIGHLYPPVAITAEMAEARPDLKQYVGHKLTVIAWIWARTVKSPNPAFGHVDVPLASTFILSKKVHKEAYVVPVIDGSTYFFTVKTGKPPREANDGTKLARGSFQCLLSRAPISGEYIKAEGRMGRISSRLVAIVAEGERGRVYLSPVPELEAEAKNATPDWKPDVEFFQHALGFRIGNYGMTRWSDLFTPRQLVALDVFSNLVMESVERIIHDALAAGMSNDDINLAGGGMGARAYAEAVALYLGVFLSRLVNLNNALCQWRNDPAKEHVGHLFTRQAIPMVWDFAEANPLGPSAGGFDKTFGFVPKVIEFLPCYRAGFSNQEDAASLSMPNHRVVSTDPPYYDNIGYADLSDFFYVWLRRALKPILPDLFSTLAVPKGDELVATPSRHGSKDKAEAFFLDGMTRAMQRLAQQAHPSSPVTIYYAFKQSETNAETGTISTGWETFLDAAIRSGFSLTGTWPMRTELGNRMRGKESRLSRISGNAKLSKISVLRNQSW